MSKAEVAAAFREAAGLLQLQGASPFRVAAYENAAAAIEAMTEDLAGIAGGGAEALEALPHIGRGLAAAILEMLGTGRWAQLERLRGSADPETLFQLIPGVGPALARQIHGHLDCVTLEGLEVAAHDGRLAAVPGIGPRRAAAILLGLSGLLNRRRPPHVRPLEGDPPVGVLLDVDREYRGKAQAGQLQMIAPKRFNPEGRAWLPILHTERGDWHFTALYSNTARAHELKKTADWVVIYHAAGHGPEGQCTVVTETSGPRRGMRVVRGRERECPLPPDQSG
jgi:DNA uptake protein ComE-like DNA-binding protein